MAEKTEKVKKSLTEEVIEGSFWSGFTSILARLGTLIFTILLARILFPESLGIYSLVISIASIFMTFADLGLDSILIRYTSLDVRKEKKAAYFRYVFKLKLAISFLVSIALLVFAYPLSFWVYKKPELFLPLLVSSFFIFSSLFVNFFSSYFYAIKKTRYIGIKEIILQITRMLLLILVFILLLATYRILGVFVSMILSNLIVILLLFIWINKYSPYILKKTKEKIDKIKVIKFSAYYTIASISGIFFTYIDTIMLGFFVSFAYIGFYRVAFTSVFGIIGLFTYVGTVLLPIFTNLKKQRLQIAFNKVSRFVLIFSIPATFGCLVLGKYFIKILYGGEYLPATTSFYILSLMLITYMPVTIISSLFFSKEKPKYVAKATFISLLVNIVLNYILISQLLKISEAWATAGAALATIISRAYLFIYLIIITKKELGISQEIKIFLKPIIASTLMLLVLLGINFIFKDMNLFLGLAEIILGILIYFSVMILIKGITKEDIGIFKKLPIFRKK